MGEIALPGAPLAKYQVSAMLRLRARLAIAPLEGQEQATRVPRGIGSPAFRNLGRSAERAAVSQPSRFMPGVPAKCHHRHRARRFTPAPEDNGPMTEPSGPEPGRQVARRQTLEQAQLVVRARRRKMT